MLYHCPLNTQLGFTPCKAERPLQVMELQDKEEKERLKAKKKSWLKRT